MPLSDSPDTISIAAAKLDRRPTVHCGPLPGTHYAAMRLPRLVASTNAGTPRGFAPPHPDRRLK